MSVPRHHNEWLSLVEASGPFLSLPVLLRVFPQGLDARDPGQASRLRGAYEEWLERGAKDPGVHHAWIRHVLQDVLGYPSNLLTEGQAIPPGLDALMATFGETLRPDMALKHRDEDQKPVLLVSVYGSGQDLEKPVSGKHWKASPGTRMMELLHAADIPVGLVTNGEQWMLVSARRAETTGFASWYADLWMQEPLTLRAFHSLLHLRRLIGVAHPDTLPTLLLESSKDQQEVTDQLGFQVRQAVEVLVQAFDRIDAESGRTLLADVDAKTLYDAALTVMMRLVFLFSAEERGLLLLGDPQYDQNYAVSTLSELLRERADQYGEEVLERRHDAWCRLLATFRAVHAGVEHEAMRLPPYGGTLFDPDRYPFLEGRGTQGSWQDGAAKPLVINNRVVLHLLEALQVLRVKVPGGPAEARRVSFSALDIEQIGHVYEGLLDHTAKRSTEPMLGLTGSKDQEPEVPLKKLEELALTGNAPLVDFLHDATGRSERALSRLLVEPPIADAHELLIACGQDAGLAGRVHAFVGLLRRDTFGRLVVVRTGSLYVTAGNDRRSTGTHYTPRSLTEPIVKHALEPLAYAGPAHGLPPEEWELKSAKELLGLKVCDIAMGSGAFLVEACRYLAARLVEAWENAEREHPGSFVVTPDGGLSTGSLAERLMPTEPGERVAIARRYVADRCLYGVDINPMAVEMAKLSLWLVTLQRDRPFTFIDHALKCGDSLLGVTSVRQIEKLSLRPDERQATFASADLGRYVEEASAKRLALEDLPSNEHGQIEAKNRLHSEAEAATATVKVLADALTGLELRGLDGDAYDQRRGDVAETLVRLMPTRATASPSTDASPLDELVAYAREQLRGRRTFHWAVEFPEVTARGGFDAIVGNPPFMGGQIITPTYGPEYRSYLVRHVAGGRRGSADLCAYFTLRAAALLGPEGFAGLIATNTISEGETRSVGLEQLQKQGLQVYRAVPLLPWPGSASLAVTILWLSKRVWSGDVILNDEKVDTITAAMTASRAGSVKPHKLAQNVGIAFKGSSIQGTGFLMSPDDAAKIVSRDAKYKDVLFPYLGGEDVTRTSAAAPTRWAINFFDWPLKQAEEYPECLEIARIKVKPSRDLAGVRNSIGARRAQFWWRYDAQAKPLYEAIRNMPSVFATAETSKYVAVVLAPTDIVFAHTVVVFATNSFAFFAVVASTIHGQWMEAYSSSLETRLKYTLADGFETYPFPSGVLATVEGRNDESPLLVTLAAHGQTFFAHRSAVMATRNEGVTLTYNRLHDRNETSEDIARLRLLLSEMDRAVADCYDWTDLDLEHGFHSTAQGERYTASEPARRIVLDRLLMLNHERHGEELTAGFPPIGGSAFTRRRRKAANSAGPKLFA